MSLIFQGQTGRIHDHKEKLYNYMIKHIHTLEMIVQNCFLFLSPCYDFPNTVSPS